MPTSVGFAFPFAWLVGTSMKYDEEIFVYPPRWLPQWPQAVGASPYVSAGAAGGFARPQGMSARRWAVLWPRIEAAIWAHARDMVSADLASRLEEGTLRVALGPALYAAAARRSSGTCCPWRSGGKGLVLRGT